MTLFYTYVWRDAAGLPFYVGKGRGRRAYNAIERSDEFLAIHAQGGCSVEIVDEFILESQALALEVELIEKYGRREFGGLLVNKTDGGEGVSGVIYTQAAIERMVAAKRGNTLRLGKPHNAETRAKISASKIGTPASPEHRAKVSAALSGKPKSPAHRASVIEANRMAQPQSNNVSGFKGVSLDRKRGKWVAHFRKDGKRRNLGRFSTAVEAAMAYDAAALEALGSGNFYRNLPSNEEFSNAA